MGRGAAFQRAKLKAKVRGEEFTSKPSDFEKQRTDKATVVKRTSEGLALYGRADTPRDITAQASPTEARQISLLRRQGFDVTYERQGITARKQGQKVRIEGNRMVSGSESSILQPSFNRSVDISKFKARVRREQQPRIEQPQQPILSGLESSSKPLTPLEKYEKQVLAQRKREQDYFNSPHAQKVYSNINKVSSFLTFGKQKPIEERGGFGQYAQTGVSTVLSFPRNIGGAVASTGEKIYLTGKGYTLGLGKEINKAYTETATDERFLTTFNPLKPEGQVTYTFVAFGGYLGGRARAIKRATSTPKVIKTKGQTTYRGVTQNFKDSNVLVTKTPKGLKAAKSPLSSKYKITTPEKVHTVFQKQGVGFQQRGVRIETGELAGTTYTTGLRQTNTGYIYRVVTKSTPKGITRGEVYSQAGRRIGRFKTKTPHTDFFKTAKPTIEYKTVSKKVTPEQYLLRLKKEGKINVRFTKDLPMGTGGRFTPNIKGKPTIEINALLRGLAKQPLANKKIVNLYQKTIAHELTHYKQPVKLKEFSNNFNYKIAPDEIHARVIGKYRAKHGYTIKEKVPTGTKLPTKKNAFTFTEPIKQGTLKSLIDKKGLNVQAKQTVYTGKGVAGTKTKLGEINRVEYVTSEKTLRVAKTQTPNFERVSEINIDLSKGGQYTAEPIFISKKVPKIKFIKHKTIRYDIREVEPNPFLKDTITDKTTVANLRETSQATFRSQQETRLVTEFTGYYSKPQPVKSLFKSKKGSLKSSQQEITEVYAPEFKINNPIPDLSNIQTKPLSIKGISPYYTVPVQKEPIVESPSIKSRPSFKGFRAYSPKPTYRGETKPKQDNKTFTINPNASDVFSESKSNTRVETRANTNNIINTRTYSETRANTNTITNITARTITPTTTTTTTTTQTGVFQPNTTPTPFIPSPPKIRVPPPIAPPFFYLRKSNRVLRTPKRQKPIRQPKGFSPDLFSGTFGIRGETGLISETTGLGLRPLPKKKRKKQRGVRNAIL